MSLVFLVKTKNAVLSDNQYHIYYCTENKQRRSKMCVTRKFKI